MRLRFVVTVVALGVAGCTISKSIPTERSSDGGVAAELSEVQEARAEQLTWTYRRRRSGHPASE